MPIVFVLIATVLVLPEQSVDSAHEGYPWKDSWLGTWGVARQQKRGPVVAASARSRHYPSRGRRGKLTSGLPAGSSQSPRTMPPRDSDSFPVRESSILPTRLGNVIRSFEGYPNARYGIDGIVLWPRIVPKLPKEFADSLDGAKSSFDFMLNCSVLSIVVRNGCHCRRFKSAIILSIGRTP